MLSVIVACNIFEGALTSNVVSDVCGTLIDSDFGDFMGVGDWAKFNT